MAAKSSAWRFSSQIDGLPENFWLVVSTYPSEKYESLSDDDIPIYEMESHKSHVPNHQPAIIPLKLPFAGDLPIKNGDFPIDTNKNHHTFSIAAATIYHVSRGINFRISGATSTYHISGHMNCGDIPLGLKNRPYIW